MKVCLKSLRLDITAELKELNQCKVGSYNNQKVVFALTADASKTWGNIVATYFIIININEYTLLRYDTDRLVGITRILFA